MQFRYAVSFGWFSLTPIRKQVRTKKDYIEVSRKIGGPFSFGLEEVPRRFCSPFLDLQVLAASSPFMSLIPVVSRRGRTGSRALAASPQLGV